MNILGVEVKDSATLEEATIECNRRAVYGRLIEVYYKKARNSMLYKEDAQVLLDSIPSEISADRILREVQ